MSGIYICTGCHIRFACYDDEHQVPVCPRCGDRYDHFNTKLLMASSAALVYWLDRNPGVRIENYDESD